MTRKTVSKTIYVANDGVEFDNELDCALYEKNPEMYIHMKAIKTYCSSRDCEDCVFNCEDEDACWFEDLTPNEW